MTIDINKLANDIYKQNCKMGWWDDPNSCIRTKIMMIVTEIAEAVTGDREVKLANALIRVLDLGAHLKLTYEPTNGDSRFEHESFPVACLQLINSITCFSSDIGNFWYRCIVADTIHLADIHGMDLKGAIFEKTHKQAKRETV